MNPIEISAIIFFCILAGAMLGMWLRSVLPENHLNDDTKDVVKLGAGLIGTMAALLLGLLVASAKSSYDARSTDVTQMAANIVLLDRAFLHYGPATQEIRGLLRIGVSATIDDLWSARQNSLASGAAFGKVFDQLVALKPTSDAQRSIQSEAESIIISIGQTRLLLLAQSGTSISPPFLVVVVFWLTLLFVSFGLFAPNNPISFATLLLAAMSVAGALFLILELDHPFSGLIQVSNVPLRTALSLLGQ